MFHEKKNNTAVLLQIYWFSIITLWLEKQTKSEEEYEKWGISCIILCFNADIHPKLYFTKLSRPLWPKKDSVIKYANIIPSNSTHFITYIFYAYTNTHTYMYWLKALRGSSTKILIKLKPTFPSLFFTTLLFSQNIHHHLGTRVCYTVNFG